MPNETSDRPLKHYDVIIVGGGMVGASLANAILPLTKAPHNLKVCVIDAFECD